MAVEIQAWAELIAVVAGVMLAYLKGNQSYHNLKGQMKVATGIAGEVCDLVNAIVRAFEDEKLTNEEVNELHQKARALESSIKALK